MERYSIWEGFMSEVEKKVATIQRKCEKLGCDFHFAKVGEEIREVKNFTNKDPYTGKPSIVNCKFIICEAEGTAVINGWEFVASVEHTSKGNIFSKALIDVEIPERYRDSDPYCEHCKSHRMRKDTFIVRNTETGEFKQVGKSCLKDFTFGMSASTAAYMASLKTIFEEVEIREIGGGMAWFQKYYETDEVLRFAAETIRHFGFSRSNDDTSTKSRVSEFFAVAHNDTRIWDPKKITRVRNLMEQVGFNPDSDEAKEMVEKAIAWLDSQEARNDYLHNLKVATSLDHVDGGKFGLLVSLFPTADRELEKEAQRKAEAAKGAKSEYVGKIGDRIDVEVESVKCITSWESCYNGYSTTTTYIWKIVGKDGNIYTWKTSKYISEDVPPTKIKGTVKEHKEFRGTKQTELTRCKIA